MIVPEEKIDFRGKRLQASYGYIRIRTPESNTDPLPANLKDGSAATESGGQIRSLDDILDGLAGVREKEKGKRC
jgi:hypothetical protein